MKSTNWKSLSDKNLGLCATLAQVMLAAQNCTPDINGPCLLVASDYSGSHRGSAYDIYSVLVCDLVHCDAWREARLETRKRFIADGRRMSYKGLHDRQRRRALGPFLRAANLIPGICASLAVSKSASTLFQSDVSPINPDLTDCLSWDNKLFERAMRIVHIVSFFIAGLSQKNQDVFWFSDEDEIAANPQRLALLTKMWANVISNYPVHSLRHLKCGTTRSDDGSNEIEDFAAIPDLVAGALSDLLTSIAGQFRLGLIVPLRLDSKAKATMIGHWLSEQSHSLKRVVLVIDTEPHSSKLTVSRIGFNDLSSIQSVRLS